MVSRITVQFLVLTAELELAKAVNGHFQTFVTKRKDIFQSLPFPPLLNRKYSFHVPMSRYNAVLFMHNF